MHVSRSALLVALAIRLGSGVLPAQSTIDPVRPFAHSANAGWISFRPSAADGVAVGDTFLSGYAYGANYGWMFLGDGTPDNGHTYDNSRRTDHGVNRDAFGNLSGYAYAGNIGWVSFGWAGVNDPNAPWLDPITGLFGGYAYSGNVGWILLGTGLLRTASVSQPDTDADGISDAWENFHFGTLNIAGVGTDFDGDGQSDAAEAMAGTDPTDGSDLLRIVSHTYDSAVVTVTITFTSTPARQYRIERTGDLGGTWLDSSLGQFDPDAGATTTRAFSFPAGPRQFLRVLAINPLPRDSPMKPSHFAVVLIAWIIPLTSQLVAQGTLDPPSGTPAPTQKSLQEIWDRIGTLEVNVASLQTKNDQLENLLLSVGRTVGGIPWERTVADPLTGSGGYSSLAIAPDGQPAIAYYCSNQGYLRYAKFNGTSWVRSWVDTLGDVGLYCSLAFTPAGQPAIAYYDATSKNLKYAEFDGSLWQRVTVTSPGDVGKGCSLAFTPSGSPAMTFEDTDNTVLRYVVKNGIVWNISTIDTIDSFGGAESKLAFTPAGQPAVCYKANSGLKYAVFTGALWQKNPIDSVWPGRIGFKFTPAGQPAVCYFVNEIRYAVLVSGTWQITTIDDTSGQSSDMSLAFTPGGQPAVSFGFDGLTYMVYDGASWTRITVEEVGGGGHRNSLAFLPSGQPAISYYDQGNQQLKYAVGVTLAAP